MEDIACADELLHFRDDAAVLVGRSIGGGRCGRGGSEGDGEFWQVVLRTEFFEHRLNAFAGGRVGLGGGFRALDGGSHDDAEAAGVVIEDENGVRDEEERFGEAERVGGRVADGRFEEPDHVVGQVADGAAGEAWAGAGLEVGNACEFVTGEEGFEIAERVSGFEGMG